MSYPTKYTRQYDYVSYQNSNPTRPLPATKVNADLNQVQLSTDEIVNFLKKSIRADGKIMNGAVGLDQIDPSVNLGFTPPTEWEAGVLYTVNTSTVFHSDAFYSALVTHTSTSEFDPTKWLLIADFQALADAAALAAINSNANLAAIAGLTTAADKSLYFTDAGVAATFNLSAFARVLLDDADASAMLTTLGVSAFMQTVLDDADAATMRTSLGVVIGTDVQAYDADLDAAAALSATGIVRRTGPGAWSAGTRVANSEAATMVQSTIKGRAVSAGTGDPTDLTATQATAILNAFVGDAGAGGTKGLVPAPVTGDAAKFLRGDGMFASIPGGGDMLAANNLGDVTNVETARQNLKVFSYAATRTALKALDTTKNAFVYLGEAGREGIFEWKAGNFATLATTDTQEGVYIKANAIATSAGIWYRVVADDTVYSVKWFGATGDNVTNDYTSIQACINLVSARSGGTVYFPMGGYQTGTGLTISTPLVRLRGEGKRYCSIVVAANINGITFSAARCAINGLSVFCFGRTTGSLITFTTGCTQTSIEDMDLVGGVYCVRFINLCTNVNMIDVCARATYGGAIVYTQTGVGAVNGGAIIIKDCVLDHDWPVQVPALNGSNNKGARANSTAYSVGDFVTSGGALLQCRVAGTSAASPPSSSTLNYGVDLADGGTLIWRLANIDGGCAVLVDSNSYGITIKDTDMTGAFQNSVHVQNGLGTNPPDTIRVTDCTMAGIINAIVRIDSCKSIWVEGNEMQAPVGGNGSTGAYGIVVGAGSTGEHYIRGNLITGGFYGAIYIGNTPYGGCHVTDNRCFGCVAGIVVASNVSSFMLADNNVGISDIYGTNQYGIIVNAGTGNHFNVINNRVYGASTAGVTTTGVAAAGTSTAPVGGNF